MTFVQKIGTYLLFFTLPIVATFKGKGMVISLIFAFLLFGIQEVSPFVKKKKISDLFLAYPQNIFFWVFLIGLWTFFSIFWSPFILKNLGHFLRIIGLLTASFFTAKGIKNLHFSSKSFFLKVFFQGFIFYLLFYLFEIYGPHLISKIYTHSSFFNSILFLRGVVILVFLFWPFSMLLKSYSKTKTQFWTYESFIILAMFLVLYKARPDAAKVAFVTSLLVWALVYWKKVFIPILGSLIGFFGMVSPLLFLKVFNEHTLFHFMHYIPTSYQHRIQIWHDISLKILEAPFMGHGFDFSSTLSQGRHMCLFFNPLLFDIMSTVSNTLPNANEKTPYSWGGKVCYQEYIFSTHPHQGFLQIWLELGGIGILLLMGLLYALCRTIYFFSPRDRAVAFSILVSYISIFIVSLGIWQNWMMSLVALTIILFLAIRNINKDNI